MVANAVQQVSSRVQCRSKTVANAEHGMALKIARKVRRDYLNIAGDEGRPGVPHVRTVTDPGEFELSPKKVFRAHWQIFVPTLAIAIMYLSSWTYLSVQGMEKSALSRLIVIVASIGVPLLAAHAFLRYQTIRVQVLPDGLRYHPGWPKDLPVDLPYDLIEDIRIKYGLLGWLFRTGTLVIDMTTGSKVAIADLHQPKLILRAITKAMGDDPEGISELINT